MFFSLLIQFIFNCNAVLKLNYNYVIVINRRLIEICDENCLDSLKIQIIFCIICYADFIALTLLDPINSFIVLRGSQSGLIINRSL